MAEELQTLLDRIQSEGVEKANARAAEIVAEAEKKAAETIALAEKKAAETKAAAEADAATLRARAEQSLAQAGRDVRLAISQAIQETLERVLLRDVSAAMRDPALVARCAEEVVKAMPSGAELAVASANAEAVAAHLRASLAADAAAGVRVAPSDDVTAGFRVFVQDGRVEHDFTAEAVAGALARGVGPTLAALAFGKSGN